MQNSSIKEREKRCNEANSTDINLRAKIGFNWWNLTSLKYSMACNSHYSNTGKDETEMWPRWASILCLLSSPPLDQHSLVLYVQLLSLARSSVWPSQYLLQSPLFGLYLSQRTTLNQPLFINFETMIQFKFNQSKQSNPFQFLSILNQESIFVRN